MNESEKHMITDRVLDYCIFSNRPVYVAPKDDPGRKTSFFVEEILEDCFAAELGLENAQKIRHEDLKGRDLLVIVGYRNQAFVFTSQLVDTFSEASGQKDRPKRTHFLFKKAHTGALQNQRVKTRFPLETYSPYLKAEIKVFSTLGDFTFETRHLADLSQTSLSLFLDRSQGLALPGDKVSSLTLFHQNEIILETEGVVQRTDMKRVSEQIKNGYFAVIGMKPPSPSTRWTSGERAEGGGLIPMEPSRAYVDADHSILRGYGFSGEIQNLSSSGLSFCVDDPEIPFAAGLILNDFYIHIPPNNLNLKACVKVSDCSPFSGGGFTVSGEFLGVSIDLIKTINRLRDGLVDSRLVEAKREDFDQLLEFFFESGFIYSAKRKQLQKYAASVRKTNLTLLQSGGGLMKKVIFKENREIKGHLSALRFFDRTWLVQHLTTHHSTGTATSRAILSSMANFFLDPSANRKVDTSFVTCFYRPGNVYPEVLFGETQRVVGNPEICDVADLDFCVSGAADEGPAEPKMEKSGIRCHEAQPADLSRLERLLVEEGHYFTIRIEGLTAEGLTNLAVSAEYAKLGLYRKRRVFVARQQEEGDAVYAVCNYASPGCNLSELTNSFRFYYARSGPEPKNGLVNALSRHVLASYKATEMSSPVLLLGEGQILPDLFKRVRKYRYWFFDAAYGGLFKKTAESNIDNLKEILRRLRSGDARPKDLSYEHA